jgi:hypothetical protein
MSDEVSELLFVIGENPAVSSLIDTLSYGKGDKVVRSFL